MSKFIVTKPGIDATSNPSLKDELVDSSVQTLLVSGYGSGQITVNPLDPPHIVNIGIPLNYVPLIFFYASNNPFDIPFTPPANAYVLYSLAAGGAGALIAPSSFPGTWEQTFDAYTSAYTTNYMYIATYLPSLGSLPVSGSLSGQSYINVAVPGVDVTTAQASQLSFSSLASSVQIVKEVDITMSATGTGGQLTMTYAHGLGKALPFFGMITQDNYTDPVNGASIGITNAYMNFDQFMTGASFIGSVGFAVDATYFYFIQTFSTNGTPYSYPVHLYFMDIIQ